MRNQSPQEKRTMAAGALSKVMRRALLHLGEGAPATDEELLEHFTTVHDEQAFAELVRRHGPMVLRVCRRVLRDAHAADDAFQATFIVLARKAGVIARKELLAGWLHGVACRIALKARTITERRRTREGRLDDGDAVAESGAAPTRGDLRPVLDEELDRLPAKYKLPIVLCYLEGKTVDEAAARLGCSRGAIAGKMSRGRDLLRARLARRGVALSVGGLGVLLAEETFAAALSPRVVSATLRAVSSVLAARMAPGADAAPAVALANQVLHTMTVPRSKSVVAVLLVACAVAASAVSYREPTGGGPAGAGLAAQATLGRVETGSGLQYVSIWSTGVSPQWLRFVWQHGMQQPIVDIGDPQKGIGFGVISQTRLITLSDTTFAFVGVGIKTGGQPVLIAVKANRVPNSWGPCTASFAVSDLTTGEVIDQGTLACSGLAN
jgi:RNA polymerase sigma factor (sigma-70 family)